MYYIGKLTENILQIQSDFLPVEEIETVEKEVMKRTIENSHNYCVVKLLYEYKKETIAVKINDYEKK